MCKYMWKKNVIYYMFSEMANIIKISRRHVLFHAIIHIANNIYIIT